MEATPKGHKCLGLDCPGGVPKPLTRVESQSTEAKLDEGKSGLDICGVPSCPRPHPPRLILNDNGAGLDLGETGRDIKPWTQPVYGNRMTKMVEKSGLSFDIRPFT